MTGRSARVATAAVGLVGLLFGHRAGPLAGQQEERLAFRHLTVADGLSQNTVQALLQDRRGFLWIGTKDGLNRHDGYTFLVFRHEPTDSSSLSDSNVTALLEDADGRLWVGTRRGGLNRFDRARKRFRRYPAGPTRPITSLAADGAGDLWIGTEGGGLHRLRRRSFDAARPAFDRFVHDPSDPGSLGADQVHDVLVDRRGELWVGTDAGLGRLEAPASATTSDPRFDHVGAGPAETGGLIDRRVSSLLEDREGRLWIGGVPGLSVLDADRASIAHHPHRYRTRRYGWGEAVDLLEDGNGRIWVSTHSELMRFDPATGAFAYLRHDPLDPEGVNSNSPRALYRDRSGVLWVGTNGYGINVHDPKAGRFRTLRRPRDRAYRNAGFSVYTIFEDSGGRVWIGAGVLYRWDRATGAFRSFETTSERVDDFGNTGAWSIVEHPPGRLWVGTFQGLYRYEIATGRWRQYAHEPADPAGLPEKQVYGVHRARDGSIWVVTRSYLARLEDPETGRFRSHRYLQEGTPNRWTFPSLREDADGIFWLGSNHGLVRFDPASGEVRRYRADPSVAGGLAHDVVRALLPDPRRPERYLWVGTAGGGLQRLDRRTGIFDRWTVEDGLPNDVVYGILADDRGHLWLSTNRGLARFDPVSGEFRSYDAADGLQSDEFNSGAAFRSSSGELFFGGPYGLNYFRPDEIEDNPHVPPVVVTGFHRRNRPETVRDSGTVLTAAISEVDTVRLSHADDVVAFDYAALDYSAPAKNGYAYRLLGFSDVWVDAGVRRSATYTNLPPGAYTFQVRGSNNDGVWNEEGASLALLVSSPWWGTRWAYALYALAVLGALYGLRRYEMNRLRLAGQLEVEQVEAAKLRELDRARTRFFGDVSHELRTPLTLVTGPLEDLLAGRHGELSRTARQQLERARRSAGQVLELINQVLEVARLEAGGTPLRARPLELGAFVDEVAAGFAPLAERERLDFAVATPAEPITVHGDPDQLEKALANLLSNAMKFTPAGGTVRVAVEGDAAIARVAVRDSGPGIPARELPHVFDRFFRAEGASARRQPGTGIGLALAREVVELHGGTLRAESEVGFGSTFVLELLRGHDHLEPDQLVRAGGPAHAPTAGVRPSTETSRPGDGPPGGASTTDGDPARGDRATVLVVEDHPEVRAYLRARLAPRYRVLEASDGEEGLEMARRRLPDLVLSDVMMPGLDGYGLCRALKSDPETAFLPVVLLTARAAAEDRLAGLEEQADDYLTKPFDPAELLARVENLIASRRRLRDRLVGQEAGLHPEPVDVEPADRVFLDRVASVLEDRLGDDGFTVERFAREVGYSRSHLHRRLRELLDETPSELVRRMRLERAAQLLAADAGTVGAVAYAVGFKSVAHFSNRFFDHFGVRPSAYAGERTGRDADGGGEATAERNDVGEAEREAHEGGADAGG